MMILSALISPLIAVQVSQYLDRRRERLQRRIHVFETLMATRAAKVSPQHVEALNAISICFHGVRVLGRFRYQRLEDQAVLDAWKVYLSHLNTRPQPDDKEGKRLWEQRADASFCDLLHAMAIALGYAFDKAFIERGIYTPEAHGNLEVEQFMLRKFLVNLAAGRATFPITVLSAAIGPAPVIPNVQSQILPSSNDADAATIRTSRHFDTSSSTSINPATENATGTRDKP